MCFADAVLGHDDEALTRGQVNAGLRRNHGGSTRDGVDRAMPVGVPHHGFKRTFVVGGREVAAFFLQLREKRIVNGRLDQQVAVAGTARARFCVLLMRVFLAASAMSAVSSTTMVALPEPTPYAGLPELTPTSPSRDHPWQR